MLNLALLHFMAAITTFSNYTPQQCISITMDNTQLSVSEKLDPFVNMGIMLVCGANDNNPYKTVLCLENDKCLNNLNKENDNVKSTRIFRNTKRDKTTFT